MGTLSDRLCFPGWSWYHSILDCQAGWGSLRFLGRKRIGTYNSQNSFRDVLGPFCIGWLLRLSRKNATFLGVHFPPESRLELTKPNQPLVLGGEAGNSRSAFNWRQRGITFSFFSQMTPSFGSEPPLPANLVSNHFCPIPEHFIGTNLQFHSEWSTASKVTSDSFSQKKF